MVATSSVGPGATNMVTAAGVAMANRLPLLLLSGDTFQSRIPDPVLQQVEHYGAPSTTVNDAFRAVTRYWDRIVHPAQVAQSLPLAVRDHARPRRLRPGLHRPAAGHPGRGLRLPGAAVRAPRPRPRRQRPDADELEAAVAALRGARRPLVVAGGGVHYSLAEDALRSFVEAHDLPVVETVAGKSCLVADHPCNVGPIGVTGCDHANRLAAEADVVLCVGTRLQDFTTGSWTVFGNDDLTLIGLNAARFDATKHLRMPLVADALTGLSELGSRLDGWRADADWFAKAKAEAAAFRAFVAETTAPGDELPTYAQVIGAINRQATETDYALTAAGGFPGELNVNWLAKGIATFDCEYGYSCMGYEIAGAWGAKMARPEGEVIAFAGDGSYLMLNSDLYSSVITGQKLIVVVCDNGGFAVIDRLQTGMGGRSFNNMLGTNGDDRVKVDWAAHARSLGCQAEAVEHDRGARRGVRASTGLRPHDGDRDRDCAPPLDTRRRLLGGRCGGGVRASARSQPPTSRWSRASGASESVGDRRGAASASASSARAVSAACTPSSSPVASPAQRSPRSTTRPATSPSSWRRGSVSTRPRSACGAPRATRRRRDRDLHEHRHARRRDRRRGDHGQADLLREAARARARRGRPGARSGRPGGRAVPDRLQPPLRPGAPVGARGGRLGRRSATSISSASRAATPPHPRSSTHATSGGIFLDMTIHDFDMARYVTGSEVVEVFARGAVRITAELAEFGDIDTAVVTLVHENGVLTVIDNSRQAVYGYDQRVEAFGSLGVAASENPLHAHGHRPDRGRNARDDAARTSSSSATCPATCASGRPS